MIPSGGKLSLDHCSLLQKIGDRASLQRVSVVGDHSSLKKSSVIRTASLGQQLSEQSRKSSGNQTEGSGEITDISGRKSSSIGT